MNIPPEGVDDDNGFLVCCDCEDDCVDKEKCECAQLTQENEPEFLEVHGPNVDPSMFGYQNRRLKQLNVHVSGIYECNKM